MAGSIAERGRHGYRRERPVAGVARDVREATGPVSRRRAAPGAAPPAGTAVVPS
ncbi:hypothetical protein [Streptomyces syringium]|uniref:hypothetical protein n=1 Tax=Streptomyces syringium TaxID=76729 RepID=UPI0033CE26D4